MSELVFSGLPEDAEDTAHEAEGTDSVGPSGSSHWLMIV